MSKLTCSACAAAASSYDGVSVGYKEGAKFLCSRCYNAFMAEHLGLDYAHVAFDPLTLQDLEGASHTFEFRPHMGYCRRTPKNDDSGPISFPFHNVASFIGNGTLIIFVETR